MTSVMDRGNREGIQKLMVEQECKKEVSVSEWRRQQPGLSRRGRSNAMKVGLSEKKMKETVESIWGQSLGNGLE